MKKLAVFSVFLGVLGVFGAGHAKSCTLQSCDTSSLTAGWLRAQYPDGTQCYWCGGVSSNNCENGTNVAVINGLGNITNIYECDTGWTNGWRENNPGKFCNNSDLKGESLSSIKLNNTDMYYSLDGGIKTTGYISGDATVLKAGNIACIVVKCKSGYEPNVAKTACVEVGRGSCEARTHMKWDAGKCICKTLGEVETSDKARCVDPKKLAKEEECRKGGATFDGLDGCVCKDRAFGTGQVWNDTQKKCVLSDEELKAQKDKATEELEKRRKNCTTDKAKASGASWNGRTCQCGATKGWVESRGECVLNAKVVACNALRDRGIKVDWSELQNDCVCTENGYRMNDAKTDCIESSDARQAREDKQKQEEADKAEKARLEIERRSKTTITVITDTSKKLTDIGSAHFDVSAWKTAEGTFNTSRLISDSVAGVVLGTAGGLITSNVIKNNQVDSGFDDISCTVGGQVVAGWGDQFRVGIR